MFRLGEGRFEEWNADPGPLALQDAIAGNQHVLKLRGELDLASAPALEKAIVRICESRPRAVTLDLRGLRFIDSTGLHAIISAGEQCGRLASEFRLIPGPRAERLFEIAGLQGFFRFERVDARPRPEADRADRADRAFPATPGSHPARPLRSDRRRQLGAGSVGRSDSLGRRVTRLLAAERGPRARRRAH
jgi:anti-sigma B factor antagonist